MQHDRQFATHRTAAEASRSTPYCRKHQKPLEAATRPKAALEEDHANRPKFSYDRRITRDHLSSVRRLGAPGRDHKLTTNVVGAPED